MTSSVETARLRRDIKVKDCQTKHATNPEEEAECIRTLQAQFEEDMLHANEVDEAVRDMAQADFKEKIDAVKRASKVRKNIDIKRNRLGLYVLMGIVVVVGHFMYNNIFNENKGLFWVLMTVMFVVILYTFMQQFREFGAATTTTRFV